MPQEYRRESRIIVEGEGDLLLIKLLMRVTPRNEKGIGNCLNTLKSVKTSQEVVLVCDNDKDRRKNLEQISDLRKNSPEIEHRTLKERENRHLLIIKPALEKWILKAADSVEIDMGKFGFQSEKHFRNISKSVQVESNNNFKNFINTINQKNAPAFVQLKNWINEIL